MAAMALGKQVTTYLRESVATAYEQALKNERKTSYALLTDAVEEYLITRGMLAPRKGLVLQEGMLGWEKYNSDLERRAQAILADPELIKRVISGYRSRPDKPRRRRRRPL